MHGHELITYCHIQAMLEISWANMPRLQMNLLAAANVAAWLKWSADAPNGNPAADCPIPDGAPGKLNGAVSPLGAPKLSIAGFRGNWPGLKGLKASVVEVAGGCELLLAFLSLLWKWITEIISQQIIWSVNMSKNPHYQLQRVNPCKFVSTFLIWFVDRSIHLFPAS